MDVGPIVMLVILAAVYFLPWIIAHNRRHPSVDGILILDLLLGWTLIGWVIALAWACSVPAIDKGRPKLFGRAYNR